MDNMSPMQRAALERGREIRHQMRGPLKNGHVASRVFRDAITAITENGSAVAYFQRVARDSPDVFLKFLGHMAGKYADQHVDDLELVGQRVYRSTEEVAEELRRRGLPVPSSIDDHSHIERERMIYEKQSLEAQLREAKAEAEALRERLLRPPLSEGGSGLRVIRGADAGHPGGAEG